MTQVEHREQRYEGVHCELPSGAIVAVSSALENFRDRHWRVRECSYADAGRMVQGASASQILY